MQAQKSVTRGSTYIPFSLVKPVFRGPSAAIEEDRFADVLALLGLLRSFLDKAAEGSNPSSRPHHDDRFARVGGEFEVGVTHVDWNVNTIVFVARAGNGVGETVW